VTPGPAAGASAIEVRRGALADLAAELAARRGPSGGADAGAFVVTDRNVEPLLPPALRALPRHVLAPGEESKSWDELGRLLLALDAAGVDRDGHLYAIGGGVVTDLGGLAASLHRRGIAWTAVPTTLVGQVDAALGGKTAVNLAGGKNTVGTFHPPRRVVVDPGLLASLPARQLAAGFAEVLKTGLIAGEELLADVEALRPADFAAAAPRAVSVIERCLRTKAALVEQDLRDEGVRQHLNLGHTFGHALEMCCRPPLLHGEAVGLGLLCAARLAAAVEPGAAPLQARLAAILRRWSLPVRAHAEVPELLAKMRRDKKRRGGAPTFVLALAPGRLQRLHDPPGGQVEAALQAVLEPPSTS
jgi:3-dehydroquinate synthetase